MQPQKETSDYKEPEGQVYFSAAPAEPVEPIEQATQPVDTAPAKSDEEDVESGIPDRVDEVVQWRAAEYIHREKSVLWYVGFAAAVVILLAVAIVAFKSITFAVLIIVMAAALVVYIYRPPNPIDYVLSSKGLYINNTLHGYAEFKGFGVHSDPDELAIEFIPVRRFRPSLIIHFPQEKGEQIVDILGVRLPMQKVQPDLFDRIVRLIGL